MDNPFETLELRLNNIEKLLFDLKNNPINVKSDEGNPIDVKAVSELTGLSVPTLYGYCHRREIPYHKLGNRLRFFRCDILDWIKSKKKITTNEIEMDAVQYLNSKKK